MHSWLKKSGQPAAQREMAEGRKFIQQSIACSVPTNTFVVIDTHTETETGNLQYGGGETRPEFAPASEVIRGYCGEALYKTMHTASVLAQQEKASETSHWFKDSIRCRGGWRVLLLATCGQAVRTENSLIDLKRLVQRCVICTCHT